MRLSGPRLDLAERVLFGEEEATCHALSRGQLDCLAPAQTGSPPTVPVTLDRGGGETTGDLDFEYLADPHMMGNDVITLQKRLLELGYTEVGVPDGAFGLCLSPCAFV